MARVVKEEHITCLGIAGEPLQSINHVGPRWPTMVSVIEEHLLAVVFRWEAKLLQDRARSTVSAALMA